MNINYILGIIILIVAVIVWGYFFRKKHYKEVDRLEEWKISIMTRPVLEELSKVKQLNMNGETEEMFENWRKEWDSIITERIPEVEELLFDAEESIDKYRFKRSKEVQQTLSVKLNEIESTIKNILFELNELVGSEERNRLEVTEMKETFRQLKKSLLAHRQNYGKAVDKLEHSLEKLGAEFTEFDEETGNGNYLNARKIVLSIKEKLTQLAEKMDKLPGLLLESGTAIPSQLSELKEGYQGMIEEGYMLNHINFIEEAERIEKFMITYKEQLDNAEVEAAEQGMNELRENINVLYDLLEKEVYSRQYIQKNQDILRSGIHEMEKDMEVLKDETISVQQSYHLTDSELEVQRKMEKQIQQLSKRYRLLELKIQDNATAASLISEEMQTLDEQLKSVMEEQKIFSGKLEALRKDEVDARESLSDLKKKMLDTSRIISKSNIPGVPIEFKNMVKEAKESIEAVQVKLEGIPLNMTAVYEVLELAVANTNKVYEQAQQMVEHMFLAEKVIQYGNRYRSKYPSVSEGLKEAEAKFRSYEYEAALELATDVVEKVEPGSMKKLEANIEEVISY